MKNAIKTARATGAFSLVELLVVIGLLAFLSALMVPALSGLRSASSVTRAASDLSMVLELARAHAMSHNTYVRVAFADVDAWKNSATPATVVLAIQSATATPAGSDMEVAEEWPALIRPLVLPNFSIRDGLEASAPDTSGDGRPSDWGEEITRKVGADTVTFRGFIQFNPAGEARVRPDSPVRHVKIAMAQARQADRDPFILRLSGMNGNVKVLHKGDGID